MLRQQNPPAHDPLSKSSKPNEKDPYWVDALAQGLSVLKAFDSDQATLTLSEIAARLGWSRTKPYRFVHTLERLGYLRREEPGRRYRLTPLSMQLGFAYLRQLPLVELAQPLLDRLRTEVGASVHMAILDDREVVYVAQARVRLPTAIDIHVGTRMPAFTTSIGRVLLAYQPGAESDRILGHDPIPALTEKSIVDPGRFRDNLAQAARQGYVFNDEEFHLGVRSVAAPVVNAQGEVVAGINATAMVHAFTDEKVSHEVIPAVCRTAAELSSALGHRP